MAEETLRHYELGLGRAVLLATDAAGMGCEGAFWILDREENKWRFFLVTSFIEHMGPREIYLLLNQILEKKISHKEMDDFAIYLCRPKDRLVRAIRKRIRTDANTTEPHEISVKWDGNLQKAIVYRLSAAPGELKVKNAQRRFRRMSGKLVA